MGNIPSAFVAPVVDSISGDIQPDGVQAAGSTGKVADAGHVHPNEANLSLYYAPTNATAETAPRWAQGSSMTPTTGTVTLNSIPLPKNLVVNSLSFFVKTQAAAGVSHGWYTILDSSMIVRAVSADQGSSTIWGTINTLVPLTMTAPFTVPSAGDYYAGFMVAASTMPTLGAVGGIGQIGVPGPTLCGISSTAQTTAPSVGSTLASLVYNNAATLYAMTS